VGVHLDACPRTEIMEVINMILSKKLGMLLLGIWLIVTGLLQVVSIPIPSIDPILAILAIAAGVFILLGR